MNRSSSKKRINSTTPLQNPTNKPFKTPNQLIKVYVNSQTPSQSSQKSIRPEKVKQIENESGHHSKTIDDEKLSTIWAIILPFIIDENKKNLDQPVMINLDQKQFTTIGITIVDEFYKDEEVNLFRFVVKNKTIAFRIIATGSTKGELKTYLSSNIKNNQSLCKLKKLIRYCCESIQIEQDPSLILQDDIPYLTMNDDSLINLFNVEEDSFDDNITINRVMDTNSSQKELDDNEEDDERLNSSMDTISTQETEIDETFIFEGKDSIRSVKKYFSFKRKDEKNKMLSSIRDRLEEAMKKKELVFKLELSGLLISSMVEIVWNIFKVFDLNEDENCGKKENLIPELDKTQK